MSQGERIVLGYHGCDPAFAEQIVSGAIPVGKWRWSKNVWDWLGHGVYFWEYAPERARSWGGKGGVVGAEIDLGQCANFADEVWTALLAQAYEKVRRQYADEGQTLPHNRGKRHDLDCLVVNALTEQMRLDGLFVQTVRGPFPEGDPAFPGSAIQKQSHVQIAVRDLACIRRVFRPE